MYVSIGRACGQREDFIMPEPYVILMRQFTVAEVLVIVKDSLLYAEGEIMTYLDYFRLQSKNLYRAWKTHKENDEGIYEYDSHLFDVDDFLLYFEENGHEKEFCLQRAQHLVAKLAGFRKWNDLIKADAKHLELGKIIFQGCVNAASGVCSYEDWEMYFFDNDLDTVPIEAQIEIAKYYFTEVEPPMRHYAGV